MDKLRRRHEPHDGINLFFAPSLRSASELMFLNHRDEAGRLEPLERTENAKAVAHIPAVDWSRYPYTAIVIPGAGNDRPDVRLSPGGKLRDEIAAKRFHEGKAPFLIASGGYVHPERTEYAEPIEMKRDLMTRFGIPEDAIIVDPHARHTTTNMRNAARLMYRYGVPSTKWPWSSPTRSKANTSKAPFSRSVAWTNSATSPTASRSASRPSIWNSCRKSIHCSRIRLIPWILRPFHCSVM
jgi:hypothetical protein